MVSVQYPTFIASNNPSEKGLSLISGKNELAFVIALFYLPFAYLRRLSFSNLPHLLHCMQLHEDDCIRNEYLNSKLCLWLGIVFVQESLQMRILYLQRMIFAMLVAEIAISIF